MVTDRQHPPAAQRSRSRGSPLYQPRQRPNHGAGSERIAVLATLHQQVVVHRIDDVEPGASLLDRQAKTLRAQRAAPFSLRHTEPITRMRSSEETSATFMPSHGSPALFPSFEKSDCRKRNPRCPRPGRGPTCPADTTPRVSTVACPAQPMASAPWCGTDAGECSGNEIIQRRAPVERLPTCRRAA